MALPEMAGDADQAVLLLIPRKGDAIIRLKAGLISPEDGGAVLLFEDHRAAEIRGMGLAAALVIDDEKRAAVGEEFAAGAVRRQLDVATLAAAVSFCPAAGRPLMLAASQNVASNGRSAFGALSFVCAKAGPLRGRPPNASRIAAPIAFKKVPRGSRRVGTKPGFASGDNACRPVAGERSRRGRR